MPRFFARAFFSDARVIIIAVLGVLFFVLLVLWYTSPEAELTRLLRNLPPEVRVVILESPDAKTDRDQQRISRPRDLLLTLLDIPASPLPADIPSRAMLIVESAADTVAPIVLLDQSVARRTGLSGIDLGSLIAVGKDSALLTKRRPSPRVLPFASLRMVQSASGLRLLIHPAWIARKFPLLALPKKLNTFVALTVHGDAQRIHVDGFIPGAAWASHSGGRLLLQRPEGAFLTLDGVSLSALFPPELPPLLAALRAEAGIGSEFRMLTDLLGDTAALLVVQAQPDGTLAMTGGVAVRAETQPAVERAVRKLLARRVAIVQAVVETVRKDGRTIRHVRPQRNDEGALISSDGVEEFHRNDWKILRASGAAGSGDLVAAFRGRFVLIGNALDPLLLVGASLRSDDVRDSTQRFFVDGTMGRHVPVVQFAFRGAALALRPWAEALGQLAVEATTHAQGLRFSADVEWALRENRGNTP